MTDSPNFYNYFKNLKQDSHIFANYHHLTPECKPETLVDRQSQIKQIWNDLKYALNHNTIPLNYRWYKVRQNWTFKKSCPFLNVQYLKCARPIWRPALRLS
ncbi:MAG: hypothetical protein ACTSQQ_17665, partial [Candidatus Helarchaeota archaeon]